MKETNVDVKQIRIGKDMKNFFNYCKGNHINSSKLIIEAIQQTHYYQHFNRMMNVYV